MTLLYRHPVTPPGSVYEVDVELLRIPGGAVARFRVNGDPAKLRIPAPAAPERADELWRTTCCELFVAGEEAEYTEFNFSPSGQWAAYRFTGYREGMTNADGRVDIRYSLDNNGFTLEAKIDYEFPNPAHVGLTAVIEETDGINRYWATGFAPGKPDFHADAVRNLLLDGVSAE